MKLKGASTMLLRFLKSQYCGATNRVKWKGAKSESYPLEKGVRQGNPCSGLLFEIYLDDLSEEVARDRTTPVVLGRERVFLLKFADDVVLPSYSSCDLQVSLDRLSFFSVGRE